MNRARKGIKSYKREIAVEFRMRRRKEVKRKNRRGSTSNGNTSW